MEKYSYESNKLISEVERQLSLPYVWHNRVLWKTAKIEIPFSSIKTCILTDYYPNGSEYSSTPISTQDRVHARERKNYDEAMKTIAHNVKKLRPNWRISLLSKNNTYIFSYNTYLIKVRQF